jgi:hypothetical protein
MRATEREYIRGLRVISYQNYNQKNPRKTKALRGFLYPKISSTKPFSLSFLEPMK